MHIMDILQNSVRAGASSVRLDIVEDTSAHALTLTLTDNGKGMREAEAMQAPDAFFTTRSTRRVGLGLPLLKQNAERTGGYFSLESKPGKGTRVQAGFVTSHPDRLVLGDVPGVFMLTVASHPAVGFEYRHRVDGRCFRLSTSEIRRMLPGISPGDPAVYSYLKEMIGEHLSLIGVSLHA